jgi:glycosyltransferase involved in cell wall biosynthesis
VSEPTLSLVMPAFQAAARIGLNVERAVEHLRLRGLAGEVIVADDGSSDGTAARVPELPNVRVLRLPHRGKGGALRAGMAAASGAIRAFTDTDLPYGLEPLDAALERLADGRVAAVVGDRTLPDSTFASPPVRRALSTFAGLAFRGLAGGGTRDPQCGFKAFRGDVAGEVFRLARVDGFAIDIEVLFLLRRYGLSVQSIPVRLEAGGAGSSTVHLLRDSAAAARDVAAIRLRWALGRYRSTALATAGGT